MTFHHTGFCKNIKKHLIFGRAMWYSYHGNYHLISLWYHCANICTHLSVHVCAYVCMCVCMCLYSILQDLKLHQQQLQRVNHQVSVLQEALKEAEKTKGE